MSKPKIAISYHFFAHYREPIMKELTSSAAYEYWFVGDKNNPANEGIRPADIANFSNFVYIPTHFWKSFYFQGKLVGFALRKDIDAIIYLGVSQFITTWFSAILARLTGKKVYFWTHGWTHPDSGMKNIIRCAFYRLAHNGLMLYGVRARQIGIEKGFDPNRLYVIYNSLNYDKSKAIREEVTLADLEEVRRENFTNPTLPMIICSSRFIKARRLDLLLDALGILKNKGYEINTLLIGEGSEKQALEEKAREMNLPVKFYGACYDERKLARMFMASQVTVIPGWAGLTVVHSMGYGTPVITNDDPDQNPPEWEAVQPGVNGDQFRYGDAGDLAEKILCWTQLQDKAQEAVVRARCIQTVEQHYTPKAQREAIEYALSGKPAIE